VGVLAYELLIGCAPFDDDSRESVCISILEREPSYPSSLSKGAKRFIRAALLKDPGFRPSARDLLDHPWIQSWRKWSLDPSEVMRPDSSQPEVMRPDSSQQASAEYKDNSALQSRHPPNREDASSSSAVSPCPPKPALPAQTVSSKEPSEASSSSEHRPISADLLSTSFKPMYPVRNPSDYNSNRLHTLPSSYSTLPWKTTGDACLPQRPAISISLGGADSQSHLISAPQLSLGITSSSRAANDPSSDAGSASSAGEARLPRRQLSGIHLKPTETHPVGGPSNNDIGSLACGSISRTCGGVRLGGTPPIITSSFPAASAFSSVEGPRQKATASGTLLSQRPAECMAISEVKPLRSDNKNNITDDLRRSVSFADRLSSSIKPSSAAAIDLQRSRSLEAAVAGASDSSISVKPAAVAFPVKPLASTSRPLSASWYQPLARRPPSPSASFHQQSTSGEKSPASGKSQPAHGPNTSSMDGEGAAESLIKDRTLNLPRINKA
jgi:hypothetical protein